MKQIPYFADMINLANKYTGPIGTVDASYYLNKQITIDELKIAEKNQLLSDLRNSTLCKDAKYSSTECTVPFILNNKEEKDIFTYVRFVKVSIAGVVESAYGFILNDYYDSVSLSLIYGKGYNIFENPKLTKIVMPLKTNFETGDVSTEIASLPTTTGYRYYSVSCLESLMKENGVQGAFTITPSAQRPSFNYRSTRIGILFIDIVNQQIQGMNFGFVNGNAKPTISFDKLNKCMVSQ